MKKSEVSEIFSQFADQLQLLNTENLIEILPSENAKRYLRDVKIGKGSRSNHLYVLREIGKNSDASDTLLNCVEKVCGKKYSIEEFKESILDALNSVNLDVKTCADQRVKANVAKCLKNGELRYSTLLNNYSIKGLRQDEVHRSDLPVALLKKNFSILQVGVYLTDGKRVAVFKRPKKEASGVKKTTSGCSLLKSVSPSSLEPAILEMELGNKIAFTLGDLSKLKNGGVVSAVVDGKSHYLFLIKSLKVEDVSTISQKANPKEDKAVEALVGWFDPAAYDNEKGGFTRLNKPDVKFNGAVDRMLLQHLKVADSNLQSCSDRGYTVYYPAMDLINDVDCLDFEQG